MTAFLLHSIYLIFVTKKKQKPYLPCGHESLSISKTDNVLRHYIIASSSRTVITDLRMKVVISITQRRLHKKKAFQSI